MSYHDPIAYTYEADFHCPDCTEKQFGRDDDGFITGIDNESNEIGAIFPWDEWIMGIEDACEVLGCSDCGVWIDEAHLPDCDEDQSCVLFHRDMSESTGISDYHPAIVDRD